MDEYGVLGYEIGDETIENKTQKLYNEQQNVLEQISRSPTRLIDQYSLESYIDNCHCPPCGCVKGDIRLILSPAGVATAVTIFAGTSPI